MIKTHFEVYLSTFVNISGLLKYYFVNNFTMHTLFDAAYDICITERNRWILLFNFTDPPWYDVFKIKNYVMSHRIAVLLQTSFSLPPCKFTRDLYVDFVEF